MRDDAPAGEGWDLVASAIAGRRLQIVPTAEGTTYTDGEIIYLASGDTVDSVIVQAALLSVGSLDPAILRRLVARKATRGRYLTLEATRAGRELDLIIPRGVRDRLRAIHDGRETASPTASLTAAEAGGVPQAPEWLGTIRPMKLLRAAGMESFQAPDPSASDDIAQDFEAAREIDEETTDAAEESQVTRMLASALAASAKLTRMMGGSSADSGADRGAGQATAMKRNRTGRPTSTARRAKPPAWLTAHADNPFPLGRWYPEWSHEKGRYLDGWCAVAEFDPLLAEHSTPFITEPDIRLRTQLARLGLADEVHRRQPDGDTLDITALVDHVVDEATGGGAEGRVYETRRRTAHDLGVLILLDATGSTGESTSGKRIFEGQQQLAARLTVALEQLGDRVATYGFYSRGAQDVRFLRVKAFGDRYDQAAQRRLGAIEPAGFTRLGAAVRHATHILRTEAGTTKTLLLVVGDGLPYDTGYEKRHAHEDTRRALSEAVERGVGCACLSMRATTDAATVQRVWGHVAHRHLHEPEDLARHVQPLFRQALREAAASRRPDTSPDRSRSFAAP